MVTVVGIPACTKLIDGHVQHATPARYSAALMQGADAVPILIPPLGKTQAGLLGRLDGLLLSGSPSNVDPLLYGAITDLTPDLHDRARDATMLPLLREAVLRGMPVLAICRGLQEMNVAFGGSLHQDVHRIPDSLDHKARGSGIEDRFLPRHDVTLAGGLAEMLGHTRMEVNSLHEQAIDRLADGLTAEAWAPDGVIEGVRVTHATGFAYGVQWHPEWNHAAFVDRLALFQSFGAACRRYARDRDAVSRTPG